MSEERSEKGQTPPPPTWEEWPQDAEDAVEALIQKVKALSAHETCGCSYDKPGDVCCHHSPQLVQARSEIAELRKALEECTGPESGCLHHSTCRAREAL